MKIKRISSSESALVVDLFDKYRIFYKQPSDINLAKHFIQKRLDNNESIIFVAIVQAEDKVIPVGFTQLYPVYSSVKAIKNWILNDLYVEPSYRQQKIAEKLIKTAMEYSQSDGAKFVELSTAVDNFTAQRLYENIGFEKQQPDKDFFTYRINVN
jgi:ribosomal protein S18 acetylase RimI-like enzyme